ncbi:hypothetical protein [[Actinomadura] parvosata]|uniref:hypothetical protein n=1 Tax=[Actinomadura] parvosata TaxID=1955412 RepID=UPI001E501C02|nr:hypothetical protein [Nonomuraea sp. ATCC 55076]
MLPAVAASAAHVRTGYRNAVEARVDRLADHGRPRAIVVAGMGGSGVAGDILAAVVGNGAPLPIVTVRSYQLPGWVGATDLVIAVSGSGDTEETLAVATQAVRRGCALLGVGAPGSPLEAIATQASAVYVPVPVTGPSRANLWLLSIPRSWRRRRCGWCRPTPTCSSGWPPRWRTWRTGAGRRASRSSTPASRWRWTSPRACR